MEFLQESTFATFFALVLTFLVAKIVFFAVSNSTADVNSAPSSVSEGAAAKEASLDRELTVRREKTEKRVKFMDDVVIRRIDRYVGSENLALFDDVKEVVEGIVGRKDEDEEWGQTVDQFGGDDGPCGDSRERKSEDGYSVQGEMDGEKTEMLFEKEGDCAIGRNVEGLATSGVKGEVELEEGDEVIDERERDGENEEIVGGDVMEEKKGRDDRIDDDDDDDDDWEGVERSELEIEFAEAVNFVECRGKGKENDGLAKLGSDVLMQLYGLHKVALEGPCLEPQPKAFMVSARAKWNAWQRLGSMSRDVAMEHYMQVLSQYIPNWMNTYSTDDMIHGKMGLSDEISVAKLERSNHSLLAFKSCRSSEASAALVSACSTNQSSVDKVWRISSVKEKKECSVKGLWWR